jgi:hypothetical protein
VSEIDRDLTGPIYVYLEKADYVDSWVKGGKRIEIKLASFYRAQELKDNRTPDETLIYESNVDTTSLLSAGIDARNSQHFSIVGSSGPHGPIPDTFVHSSRHEFEDGRVLCFSRTYSQKIADWFNREFCVRIDNVPKLKEILDSAVGSESIAGKCQYTLDFQRNAFLKGMDQEFMDEFRFYWPKILREANFVLPPGVGVNVSPIR